MEKKFPEPFSLQREERRRGEEQPSQSVIRQQSARFHGKSLGDTLTGNRLFLGNPFPGMQFIVNRIFLRRLQLDPWRIADDDIESTLGHGQFQVGMEKIIAIDAFVFAQKRGELEFFIRVQRRWFEVVQQRENKAEYRDVTGIALTFHTVNAFKQNF